MTEDNATPQAGYQARRTQGPLAHIRRPKLLIRAARLGLADYSRSRDLKRIMRVATLPAPTRAVRDLIATEAEMEEGRQTGLSTYSVIRHVEVMIALMAEAKLLPQGPLDGPAEG
ncbi:DUF6477 family protein [Vannielia litorea]|uniref:Uncharacterized protein n=1 Tax=Vannielia litorea TaxID=1217970 RepID=A0A1N6FB32_9RHOB|nr:DUF6477 family protein [Vannielia litorea]SIN92483.1 hypothetical protein SAMN05444002_1529 [Vannielia litorea]